MAIFQEKAGSLKKLAANLFTKEKELQNLVENNLFEVLDMYFLASEYPTTFGGRIDTIAVDSNGAPVIIEFKRNKNDNVINQALSYLRWLKAQKVEFFEMLLIKKLGSNFASKIQIDWTNPRVICIAENYNKFDIDTVEVIPVRLELYRYRYYDGGIFSLESLNTLEKEISTSDKISIESKLIDENPIIDLLEKATPQIKEVFEEVRSRIMQIDESIVEKVTSLYFAYRISKNFAEIHVGKNQIKVYLRPIDYIDPLNRIEKIPESYNWSMDRRIYIRSLSELEYALTLVEQSYKSVI